MLFDFVTSIFQTVSVALIEIVFAVYSTLLDFFI